MFAKDFHLTHSRSLDSVVLVLTGGLIMGWLAPQVWTFQGQLPITPQSLLVVLWGVLWGWQVGTCAVLLYLVVGGLGRRCLPTEPQDGRTSGKHRRLFVCLPHGGIGDRLGG